MRRHLPAAVLLLAIPWCLAAPPATACSCGPVPSLDRALADSSVVFAGTVDKVRYNWRYFLPLLWRWPLRWLGFGVEPPGDYEATVHFEVIEGFKGVETSRVAISSDVSDGSCGIPWERGWDVIVYAYPAPQAHPPVGTSMCTRTMRLDEGELAALRAASAPIHPRGHGAPDEAGTSAAPPPRPDSGPEAPASQTALFVRERLTSPPACAPLLRGNDLPAWSDCRDERQASGATWPAAALLVLGCFDPAAGAWREPADCLRPSEPVVSAAGGGVRLEDPAPVLCEASGDWVEGIPAHFPPGDDSRFAVTASSLDSLRLLPPGPGPALAAESASALAAAVERDVGESAPPPGGALEVDQVVEADLDGDGRADRLVAARLPSVEEIFYRFSGLYLVDGAAPDSWVLLMASEIERFRVHAMSDLDRDGSPEIVLETRYYEGAYTYLYRFAGNDLVMLGGWGCGA